MQHGLSLPASMRIPSTTQTTPQGWLKDQLHADLHHGLVGQYHRILPSVDTGMFAKQDAVSLHNRQSADTDGPLDNLNRKPWWAGEHEGYWKDAVARHACLLNDSTYLGTVAGWVDEIVDAARDNDGYVGIYGNGSRLFHRGENGELWVQSRIMMLLLVYYEHTGDRGVLDTVTTAVERTIGAYYPGGTYFTTAPKLNAGGVYHGAGFIDVLEWLLRITGEQKYAEYARMLYDDYSQVQNDSHCDLQERKLLDTSLPFNGHTPHVVEGLLMPFLAGDGEPYTTAARSALHKLAACTTPSGSFVGDENVNGRQGTADTPYEYCSTTEGLIALNRVAALTGDLTLGDHIEKLAFNAAPSARFPLLTACAYLSTDNRVDIDPTVHGGRFEYAATHAAAACCTLNAGRLLPHYVEGMWREPSTPDGPLTLLTYGPSRFQTQVYGCAVSIDEATEYPFTDDVTLHVTVERGVAFGLRLRKPFGAKIVFDNESRAVVDQPGCTVEEDERSLTVHREWQQTTTLSFRCVFDIVPVDSPPCDSVPGGGYYLQRGPLLFALKLPAEIREREEINGSGFYRYDIRCTDRTGWDYRLDPAETLVLVRRGTRAGASPWEHPPVALEGRLRTHDGQPVTVELVPFGATVLRRLVFPT